MVYSVITTADVLLRYHRITLRSDGLVLEEELGAIAAAYVIS